MASPKRSNPCPIPEYPPFSEEEASPKKKQKSEVRKPSVKTSVASQEAKVGSQESFSEEKPGATSAATILGHSKPSYQIGEHIEKLASDKSAIKDPPPMKATKEMKKKGATETEGAQGAPAAKKQSATGKPVIGNATLSAQMAHLMTVFLDSSNTKPGLQPDFAVRIARKIEHNQQLFQIVSPGATKMVTSNGWPLRRMCSGYCRGHDVLGHPGLLQGGLEDLQGIPEDTLGIAALVG